MRAILILFDTLNRHFLPSYGNNWVHAPNFKRLSEKTVIFDNCYTGSLMCIPARRELHTGRHNFLHRSWGPLEPFDDSMPETLKNNGVYAHLVSDHYHYWEDGGATYHNRYNSWQFARGHEGDPWKGEVKDPEIPDYVYNMRENWPHWRQDWVNRKYMQEEENQPLAKTFEIALEFIETNEQEDNWFLHIETFDPHEPFFTPQKYKELYKHDYSGPHFDWPNYGIVVETDEQVDHIRKEYAASISMCDNYLGKVLDLMDQKDMWKDTMLIVTTDHGFLLGEKGWWAKAVPPIYNEIAHIPLFIWDPRSNRKNERRNALVQTTDLAPTILEFFRIKRPKFMHGKVLRDTVDLDEQIRDVALFGAHGAQVNITDGRYVYMRGPNNILNKPLFNYTLMPTHMRGFFSINEIKTMELADSFNFTKDCKLMRFSSRYNALNPYIYGSDLFDLQYDPTQEHPIYDTEIERRMIKLLIREMKRNNCPVEQYQRLGIPFEGEVTEDHLVLTENRAGARGKIGKTEIICKYKGQSIFSLLMGYVPKPVQNQINIEFEKEVIEKGQNEVDEEFLMKMLSKFIPKNFLKLFETMAELVKIKGK